MKAQRDFYEEVLLEATHRILPFWSNLEDTRYGGHYGRVNYDLSIDTKSEKGGIATARHLWSWSAAYRVLKDPQYLRQADIAYIFLKEHIMDDSYKGIYWMVANNGRVKDARKHIYAQAFAIYGLCEYYRVSEDAEALAYAQMLFELIESVGYDSKHGVYREEFDRFWREVENEMLSENGIIAEATTNTHLHILEAYTNLYRVWPDPKVYKALKGLIDLFTVSLYKQDSHFIKVFYTKQFQEIIDIQSYGHDIEASWLLKEAIDVLGIQEKVYTNLILNIAENIYNTGLNLDGSVKTEREGGVDQPQRVWWVQAEAMVGFYNAYEMTGETKYIEAVQAIWAYTKAYLIDSRDKSEWFWCVDADGSPVNEPIAEPWKTPYHNIRFCIEIIERINNYDS